MRSLNWKLSGALLLIVVISVALMAYLTNLSTTSEFRQYVSAGNMMYTRSLADSLADFYSVEKSWDNLQKTIESLPVSDSQRIIVADNAGTIIGDSFGEWIGDETADIGLSNGTVISVSGENTGTLYVLTSRVTGRGHMGGQMMSATEAAEEDFLDKVNNSLWKVGLITAAVALVIGLILTRQITRPVKALITGARRLSKGELSYRVETRSNDEIGELADSFNSMATTLERVEHSRRQLTADIAHELRTPLTIIEGTVEGILDGVFEADDEHLNSIKEQTWFLTHLINDLRDISLAESGQLNLNHQPTNIVDLAKRVVTGYEPNAGEKNIQIDISNSVASLEMEIDPVRIEQVLSNLVRNAIRHTPAGGSITVTIDRINNSLELSVSDTGEGIEPEDLPHVFERFYRSGTSRSRKEGGTGLGLAIVKQMVEAHGGSVSVESTPGKGSIFRILLPVKR
ncbi:sensor histidine kinase [Chloroflexota bacterium]